MAKDAPRVPVAEGMGGGGINQRDGAPSSETLLAPSHTPPLQVSATERMRALSLSEEAVALGCHLELGGNTPGDHEAARDQLPFVAAEGAETGSQAHYEDYLPLDLPRECIWTVSDADGLRAMMTAVLPAPPSASARPRSRCGVLGIDAEWCELDAGEVVHWLQLGTGDAVYLLDIPALTAPPHAPALHEVPCLGSVTDGQHNVH